MAWLTNCKPPHLMVNINCKFVGIPPQPGGSKETGSSEAWSTARAFLLSRFEVTSWSDNLLVRFVLKIAVGLFISDLRKYSSFSTMLNVSVRGAVSFYHMGQGSTTSCNHSSGKNTRKEVMKRCKYSSFQFFVHSTEYQSNFL